MVVDKGLYPVAEGSILLALYAARHIDLEAKQIDLEAKHIDPEAKQIDLEATHIEPISNQYWI